MNVDDIRTVAVVGAGDMGHGIAEVAMIADYKVNLYDVKQEFVDRAEQRIYQSLDKLVSKGKVPADQYEKIKGELLKKTVDLADAVKDADLVIEAAPEILDLKKEIFAKMDRLAPPHTLLASNTSTMSITEIGKATNRQDKVLGLHYFNPAVLMKLVEVIRGDRTSDETIQIGFDFAKKNNKVPVIVKKDVPGFIANRVNAPASVLIGAIIESGEIQPEEIDAFVRSFGAPMGPCELVDYTGVDVNVHMARYYATNVHPDYVAPPHLVKMAEEGNFGKKTGKGYFDWSQGRPNIDLSKATDKLEPMNIVAVQVNEATKLIEMGVCSAEDVDLALTNSSGNPVGPMSVAKEMEPFDLAQRLERLAKKYKKEIFNPTKMVREGRYK
ncbi:MAG: 3-hydroxyacyl-CoA dehydrogenase family protein [Candidatus Hydrogenedentes bacterium]|nr:3-hydroxyacyl-CoA dehydrogenase family protein [Candidatus Hydrogenedentota bacterium]